MNKSKKTIEIREILLGRRSSRKGKDKMSDINKLLGSGEVQVKPKKRKICQK